VLVVVAVEGSRGPKRVTHEKAAAEAESGSIEPFHLLIEDVRLDAPTEGSALRVVHRSAAEIQSAAPSRAQKIRTGIIEYLRACPEASKRQLRSLGGGQRNVDAAIDSLLSEGLIVNRGSGSRAAYFLRENSADDAEHEADDAEPSSYEEPHLSITKNPTEGAA
jgi:hypothetical protein